MKLPASVRVQAATLSWAVMLLAGCGNISHIGTNTDGTPVAAVATVAQPFTIDANGVLQTQVRAGAEVVLTGTNSQKANGNGGTPILTYAWQQISTGSTPIDLIPRTTDSVSFTAPDVAVETPLTIRLTVTDASGNTSSATGVVTVEPIPDGDHFLEYLLVDDQFTVTAATSAVAPGSQAAAYGATMPFTVTVTKLVSFTDINGVQRSMVPVGQPVTYSSGWSASLGSGGTNCQDARNPQLKVPVPRLNLDDELTDGSARLSDVLETSDIDLDPANPSIPRATVYAQVQIQASSLPSGTTPVVCVADGAHDANPLATVTSTRESLMVPSSFVAPYDTSATAHAYYATIDPTGSKGTLSSWLTLNGFNATASDYGADAHAVYTNNFDLGFGRDMYMRFGACDGSAATLPLQQRIGQCDVAAVVINYGSIQGAAYKLNPIVAVAMEFSRAPNTDTSKARFVKFYVFAPDTRTGAFQRVTTVDLDRRGQKAVPQSCVVCHGGTPGTVTTTNGVSTYSNGGDVSAGFLSWDLDSLYFTDTDPGFSVKAQDAATKAKYTRANQEPQFKLLNSGAYLTLGDPKRFALEQELIEGWYGGSGLSGSFDGTFVPPDWQPGGADGNPADSATLYSTVFAHHCRACHVLQVPGSVLGHIVDPRTAPQFPSPTAPSSCIAAATGSAAFSLLQYPMGCYREFANATTLAAQMSAGHMPFARRTMDRLWVQADGSQSAGSIMQQHFAGTASAFSAPGAPIAQFLPLASRTPPASVAFEPQITVVAANDAVTGAAPDVGNAVRLDGTGSSFAGSVAWDVTACTGTPAAPGTCQRELPVVGSNQLVGYALMDDTATYRLSLKLGDGSGAGTAAAFYYQVPEVDPQFVSPPPALSLQVATAQVVPLQSLVQLGNGGVAGNTVMLTPGPGLSITPAACSTAPGCAASAIPAGFTIQSTGNAAATSSLAITVTGSGTSPKETVNESLTVNVTSSLQAPAIRLPAVSANSGATAFNLLQAAGGLAAYSNCTALQVVNVAYTGARKSLATFDPASQTLTYTPQPGFATYASGGTTLMNGPDETLTYALQCTHANATIETSNASIIVIPVQARVTFAAAQGTWLNAPCSACHTTGIGPTLGSVTYQQLASGSTGDSIDGHPWNLVSVPFVDLTSLGNATPDLSSVPNSALLCFPTQTCTPGSGLTGATAHPVKFPVPTDGQSSVLSNVLEWIEDGANDF